MEIQQTGSIIDGLFMAGHPGIPVYVLDADRPVFKPFGVDKTVADGETIPVGDNLTIQVISTPGHTRDSLSYYIPEKKILFASEAVGLPDKTGYIRNRWPCRQAVNYR